MSWLGDFLDQRNNEAKSIFGGVPGADKAIDINSSIGMHPLSFQTGGLLGGNQGVINWGGDNGTDKGTGAITTNGLSGINTGEKKNQNIAEAIALYLGGSAAMGSGSSGTSAAGDGYVSGQGGAYSLAPTSSSGVPVGGGINGGYGAGAGSGAESGAGAGTSSSDSSIFKNIGRAGKVMSMLGGGSGNTDQPQSQPKTNQGIGVAPDQNSPTYTAALSGQVNQMGTPTDAPVAPPVNTPQTNTPQVPMTALQAKVASMGTGQKIMAGMGEFGAALNGRPSPLNSQIANDQAALQNNITSFNEGMNVLGKLPPGDQRDQFVQSMAPQMGKMQPAFESLAKMPDGQRQLMMNYYQDSPTLQDLMKRDPSGNLAMKFFNSPNGMTHVQAEAEQNKSGLVATKVATLAEQAQTIDPNIAAQIQTQGYTTPRQIQQLSDKASTMDTAHSKFALTPADQFVLSGDKADHVYSLAGTMNSKGMDAINVKQAENDNATTPFMKEAAALYGKGTPEYNDAVKSHIARMDTPAINTAVTLSGDALDQAAARYRLDGTLPTGLGRGGVNQAAILSRAADQAKNSGQDGESLRISQIANKASTQALGQVSKQENMVGSFEKTANMNADLALAASDKVDRTGTPVINRWIQAGRQNITGDVPASQFNAYNNVFANEYAKVISGTMGNTPVSDQARSHALDVINTAQTKEQYAGVITALKADMTNRMTGFAQQRQAITSGMKTPGTATPSVPTFASEADAKAANLTSGTKIIINGQSGTWH